VYAISHAATALVLKRRFPEAGLGPLLVAVQAVELVWVLFTYLGIEHVRYTPDALHLDFLPYSHSVFTGVAGGLVAWLVIRHGLHRPRLAAAVGLGIASHVVLDLIQHEPDIPLLPLPRGPRFGLGLAGWPLANLTVEVLYGLACWWIFRGGRGLLVAIVGFNLLNAPFMFPRQGGLLAGWLARHPAVLPTVILVQIVMTWLAVWWGARPERAAVVARGANRRRS
jgi:hypothetical protein